MGMADSGGGPAYPVKHRRLLGAAEIAQQRGEVVERGGHVRVEGPKDVLTDGERLLVVELSQAKLAPVVEHHRQVVEGFRRVRVEGPQALGADPQAAFEQR